MTPMLLTSYNDCRFLMLTQKGLPLGEEASSKLEHIAADYKETRVIIARHRHDFHLSKAAWKLIELIKLFALDLCPFPLLEI